MTVPDVPIEATPAGRLKPALLPVPSAAWSGFPPATVDAKPATDTLLRREDSATNSAPVELNVTPKGL